VVMQVDPDHAELQAPPLRRWVLLNQDAHGCTGKTGFTEPVNPDATWKRFFPDVYKTKCEWLKPLG